MRRLGVRHVTYALTTDGGKPYSLCENFITPETELIPAWRILRTQKQPNHLSLRSHFLSCCETLGIPGVKEALDHMLTSDYIIANEDRHWNNFGLVRNANTLEWLGFAPVFDSGTSLWYSTNRVGAKTECKPFRSDHNEQIKLVDDFSWFDIDALDGLVNEALEILLPSEDVDSTRGEAIAKAIMERAGQIEQLRKGHKPSV